MTTITSALKSVCSISVWACLIAGTPPLDGRATTKLYSSTADGYTTVISRVEINRNVVPPATEPATPALYARWYEYKVTRVDGGLNATRIGESSHMGDVIEWDEPEWVAAAFQKGRLVIAYNQFDQLRLLTLEDGGDGELKMLPPETFQKASDVFTTPRATKCTISIDTPETVRVLAVDADGRTYGLTGSCREHRVRWRRER